MRSLVLALFVCFLSLTASCEPTFNLATQQSFVNKNLRLHWDKVEYKVVEGFLNETQRKHLETSLRKWCKCPVRNVDYGQNLAIIIQKYPRQGVCIIFYRIPTAVIIIDPDPEDGFQAVIDHEVHHLVHPYFHP